jgi:hypothetical protein
VRELDRTTRRRQSPSALDDRWPIAADHGIVVGMEAMIPNALPHCRAAFEGLVIELG